MVASIEPSGENRTSFTSLFSCPIHDRTDSPVVASRRSIVPVFSGPSVTKTPSGLQSTVPPRSCSVSTIREAITARWSASSASGSTVPSTERVVVDRLEREQDAPLRVDLEVRDGGGGELARGRGPLLRLGAPLLARREHGEADRDERGDGEHGDERRGAAGPTGARAPASCACASLLLGLSPIPLRAATRRGTRAPRA